MCLSTRIIALVLVFGLAACASPSPRFIGAASKEIEVAGSRFTVFRRGDEVEAFRTSREWLPRQSEVFMRAEAAIRAATGCDVRPNSMTGDQAIVRAELDCP